MLSASDFDRSSEEGQLSKDEALMHLFDGSKLHKSKVTVLTDPARHDWVSVEALVVGSQHEHRIVKDLH